MSSVANERLVRDHGLRAPATGDKVGTGPSTFPSGVSAFTTGEGSVVVTPENPTAVGARSPRVSTLIESSEEPLCGAGTPIVTSRGESAAQVRTEFETDQSSCQAAADTLHARKPIVEHACVGVVDNLTKAFESLSARSLDVSSLVSRLSGEQC